MADDVDFLESLHAGLDLMRRHAAARPAPPDGFAWRGLGDEEPTPLCGAIKRTQGERCKAISDGWLGDAPMCSYHLNRAIRDARKRVGEDVQQRAEVLFAQWAENAVAGREPWQDDPRTPIVYFAEREGFVKIGTTTNPARIKTLGRGGARLPDGMTAGPVRLLATTNGDRYREQELHQRFAHLRYEGEWFLLGEEIRAFIDALPVPVDTCST